MNVRRHLHVVPDEAEATTLRVEVTRWFRSEEGRQSWHYETNDLEDARDYARVAIAAGREAREKVVTYIFNTEGESEYELVGERLRTEGTL